MKGRPLRVTTPAINLLHREHLEEMNAISMAAYASVQGRNLVKHTQSRLGRQTRTWVGEFRYFLWEFPTYTLWVANGKGFSVEVLPTLTPDEALSAYREAFTHLTKDTR